MPITKRNVLRHELIGFEARVTNSSDPTLLDTYGVIIDETRNILIIEQDGRAKILPKASSRFMFTSPNGEKVEVDGEKLVGRPEGRVKLRR